MDVTTSILQYKWGINAVLPIPIDAMSSTYFQAWSGKPDKPLHEHRPEADPEICPMGGLITSMGVIMQWQLMVFFIICITDLMLGS